MSHRLKKVMASALFAAATLSAGAASAVAARNVVLVHGAFADGSGWRGVYDRLVAKGYRVTIVQEPETGIDADVDATTRAIAMQDGPVVLVGHSWGGAIISQAGMDPKVSALVYVAAVMPDVGESAKGLLEKYPTPGAKAIKPAGGGYVMLDPTHFHENFAADIPREDSDFMANSQVQIPAAAFEKPAKVAAWKDKPSFAVVAGADKTMSPDLERWLYKRGKAKTTEVPGASHVVYLSHPDKIAAVIEEAAGQ